MDEHEIKARGYGVLYRMYHNLFNTIRNHAQLKAEHCTQEDQIKALSQIGDMDNYTHNGFLRKGDLKLIKTLEYILGERDSLES